MVNLYLRTKDGEPGHGRSLAVVAALIFQIGTAAASPQTSPAIAESAERRMPPLAGPFSVGRREYVWSDPSRPEDFIDSTLDGQRTLIVWVWYPAVHGGRQPSFLVPRHRVEAMRAQQKAMFPSAQPTPQSEQFFAQRGQSVDDAVPVAEPSRFPVVLFVPSGSLLGFNFLVENLASRGFIVAGIHTPGFATPTALYDGRSIKSKEAVEISAMEQLRRFDADQRWYVGDASFVLDRLEKLERAGTDPLSGRMDLQRAGIFGFSYGGTTALDATASDLRFKAGANLDGSLHAEAVRQPFLLFNTIAGEDFYGDKWQSMPVWLANALLREVRWQRFLVRSPQAIDVRIDGLDHGSFQDGSVDEQRTDDEGRPLMEGSKALPLIGQYVNDFFSTYLKGEASALLTHQSGQDPGVQIERSPHQQSCCPSR